MRHVGHLLIGGIAYLAHCTSVHLARAYGHALLRDSSNDSRVTLAFLCSFAVTIAVWQPLVWSVVLSFYWLTQHHERVLRRPIPLPRRPLPASIISWLHAQSYRITDTSEPPLRAIIPVALRNMAAIGVWIVLMSFAVPRMWRWLGWPMRSSSLTDDPQSFHVVAGWTMIHFATSDVFFYGGHWLMHLSPRLFDSLHRLHHTSHATSALSGYYMGLLDFFFEHGPIFVSFFLWRDTGASWATAVCVGAFNLLVTHSGWDLAFLPDPVPHYLHHRRQRGNYGIFLDYFFGTVLDPAVNPVKLLDCGTLYRCEAAVPLAEAVAIGASAGTEASKGYGPRTAGSSSHRQPLSSGACAT